MGWSVHPSVHSDLISAALSMSMCIENSKIGNFI